MPIILLLVTTSASAQGDVLFLLDAHGPPGVPPYFTLAGTDERSPTLEIEPGANVTITLTGTDSSVHNVCFEGECSDFVTHEGETGSIRFVAPAEGGSYYCQPHRDVGMHGQLAASGVAPEQEEDDADAPGFGQVGAVVALGALALAMRRK